MSEATTGGGVIVSVSGTVVCGVVMSTSLVAGVVGMMSSIISSVLVVLVLTAGIEFVITVVSELITGSVVLAVDVEIMEGVEEA